jgi:predicted lipoprotein with Yx(FWY)xxD motif
MSTSHVLASRVILGLVAVALGVAACSSGASPSASPVAPASVAASTTVASATASSAAAPAASSGGGYGGGGAAGASSATSVVITMATTSLGPVLTGSNGLTLYVHAGDTATSSTCTGGCATAWPPIAVAAGAAASAGTGVTGTLGTLMRADGTLQVTYNGMPLYGWMNDTKPGDVTGQGINGFSVAKP